MIIFYNYYFDDNLGLYLHSINPDKIIDKIIIIFPSKIPIKIDNHHKDKIRKITKNRSFQIV
ncbi:hypothetical protein MHHB_P0943 [Methanofervidicoccus abyssi]|uniref:Uncharacterized protein n=1 Tax=Methanofervidicoccus abyssi TaxID=2082189 RepID=A0A401HR63_9EURY|nr:hypothetical protein MHHB_P0943 [Methanofervidicoccus abyssi]